MRDKISGDFDTWVTLKDPMYMHEYGHYIDSQMFGPGYVVWLSSVVSATRFKQLPNEPLGVTTHDQFWTEMRANRNAKKYFRKYYGVDWNTPYRFLYTYETYYPTEWRW